MPWPSAPLNEILTPISRPVSVIGGKTYRLLGAHWYARGLYVKEEKDGSEIRAATLYAVEPGDFVYNRLFAWKGAFAVVAETEGGCFVSNEFPCFRVNTRLAEPGWVLLCLSREQAWTQALDNSTGGTPTSRNRLKENRLLAMHVSLPSLPEQRRMLAWIEKISAGVAEVLNLRKVIDLGAELLPSLMAHRPDLDAEAKRQQGWVEVPLGEITHQSQDRYRVVPDVSYPNLGIYSFGRGLFEKPAIDGARTSASDLYRVRAGQFIYSRLFAFEGSYGLVGPEFDGYYVSGEYPTFDCDPQKVLPEFLEAYFRFPPIWPEVAAGSKGLGDRRQRVQPAKLLAHHLMLPPLPTQKQISRVNGVLRKTKPVRDLSSAELSALLPASLERAFAGGL